MLMTGELTPQSRRAALRENSGQARGGRTVPETVIIKPALARQFEEFIARGRILFFGAPCGYGKTALANALIVNTCWYHLSVNPSPGNFR